MGFVSLLRKPDYVYGATEKSDVRFEENDNGVDCPIKYTYSVEGDSAKIIVYPGGSPVKYLKFRFCGDLSFVDKVYGDQFERQSFKGYLEWRSVMGSRILPWFCYLTGNDSMACYGVKTGCNCFAMFQVDTHGVTLFLNLCNGNDGTDLQEPIIACEVVESFGETGEDEYSLAKAFSKKMCDAPVLPKEPVFGTNNWYWAYSDISFESVLEEANYLKEMTCGCVHKPYLIIDDGWQKERIAGRGRYIGGEWEPNERFRDMRKTADEIIGRNLKAGLWFRPLLTRNELPEGVALADYDMGIAMDPSHPYTLEKVESDARKIRSWGYSVIKHDFSTLDTTGVVLTSERHDAYLCKNGYKFFDKTKTTAMIIKDLYKAIQRGAGDADVIGCNTIGHLAAGIHSIQRTGNDSSGRTFEWTRRHSVNAVMRLPMNKTFFMVDPDCAAFTEQVSADINLDFLEMCAITGMTTLASVTPGILKDGEMKRINEIYKIADKANCEYGIKNYSKTANPEIFVSEDKTKIREFDWSKAFHGARIVLDD